MKRGRVALLIVVSSLLCEAQNYSYLTCWGYGGTSCYAQTFVPSPSESYQCSCGAVCFPSDLSINAQYWAFWTITPPGGGVGGVKGGGINSAVRVNGNITLYCTNGTAPSGSGYDQQLCPSGTELFQNFQVSCNSQSGTGNDNGTPIIIDVDGSGYHLTSVEGGVPFDFFGVGAPVQISWTEKGSTNAFLVRDLSGTGKITNGKEMFGNLTEQPKSNHPNGFAALARYDENNDGWIDGSDAIWKQLLLWQDTNHNGVTDAGELHSLEELGVKRISVRYREDQRVDSYGNIFKYEAAINDASVDHRVYDVILQYKNLQESTR